MEDEEIKSDDENHPIIDHRSTKSVASMPKSEIEESSKNIDLEGTRQLV